MCLHEVKKSLLVVLMLLYILMNGKSATSGRRFFAKRQKSLAAKT